MEEPEIGDILILRIPYRGYYNWEFKGYLPNGKCIGIEPSSGLEVYFDLDEFRGIAYP